MDNYWISCVHVLQATDLLGNTKTLLFGYLNSRNVKEDCILITTGVPINVLTFFPKMRTSRFDPWTYVTGFAKRDHIPQILISSY